MNYFTPSPDDYGNRLDVFLSEKLSVTRSAIKCLVEEGKVFVDGIAVKKCGEKVKKSEISVIFDEPKELDATPQDLPIDIVYQDSDIVVVNKAQGMVTHPAVGTPDGTLVNALLFHIKDLSTINGVYRPGIVHRLDKDTSGLLVVAKSDRAHLSLAEQISEKTAERYYYGLVVGNVKEEGTVDKPIDRSRADRMKMAVVEGGRRAVTHYKPLVNFGSEYTLCEFKLETGRTHQIRVHMRHIGHPIVGDSTYGIKTAFGTDGQYLHSHRLILTHPVTGERMTFDARPPERFLKAVQKLSAKYGVSSFFS